MEPLIIKTDLLIDKIVQVYVGFDNEINFRWIEIYSIPKNPNFFSTQQFSIERLAKASTLVSDRISIFIIPNEFNFSNSFKVSYKWSRDWDSNENIKLELEEIAKSYILFV